MIMHSTANFLPHQLECATFLQRPRGVSTPCAAAVWIEFHTTCCTAGITLWALHSETSNLLQLQLFTRPWHCTSPFRILFHIEALTHRTHPCVLVRNALNSMALTVFSPSFGRVDWHTRLSHSPGSTAISFRFLCTDHIGHRLVHHAFTVPLSGNGPIICHLVICHGIPGFDMPWDPFRGLWAGSVGPTNHAIHNMLMLALALAVASRDHNRLCAAASTGCW